MYAADPFARQFSESLTESLEACGKAGRALREGPARDWLGLTAASSNLRVSEILPGPVEDFGTLSVGRTSDTRLIVRRFRHVRSKEFATR